MPKSSSPRSTSSRKNDEERSREELLKELRSLRRQYVNLKILEYEHEKAVTALRESEDKYRQIVESANDIIYRIDPRGYFTYANHAAVRIIGYPLKEIIGRNYLEFLHPGSRKMAMKHYLIQTTQRIPTTYFEFQAVTKRGSTVWLGQNVQLILQGKKIVELQAVARDITELKEAERMREELELQLRQAQKMESIGRLAGGIAHDFNNILGIILAHGGILEKSDIPEKQRLSSLEAINKTVARAKNMVRELLTLARKTEPSLEQINVNKAIEEFLAVIEGTFPASVRFAVQCEKDLLWIEADSNQFHQLLLNLLVNARDAMPNGGTITVRTKAASQENVRERFHDAPDGSYVCIAVEDTGLGMDESTRTRIFDPFFSTKEHGKGSGLGLAVVYGIVQSHRGFIEVESAPGQGASFRVYFPAGTRKPLPERPRTSVLKSGRGSEGVLVVEDEDLLRQVIVKLLKERGYSVFEAKDGIEAVDLFMKNQKSIDVVFSDMGLPKLGGWEACVTMREIKPDVRILLASGFVEPHVKSEIDSAVGIAFVAKPYEHSEVVSALRRVLDEKTLNS